MKTYKMHGGGIVNGKTPKEIVVNMRKISSDPGDNLEDFMRRTSAACKLYNKATIRTDNYNNFADLLMFKYLEEE